MRRRILLVLIADLLMPYVRGQPHSGISLQIEPPKSPVNRVSTSSMQSSAGDAALPVSSDSLQSVSQLASTEELQKLIDALLQNADAAKIPSPSGATGVQQGMGGTEIKRVSVTEIKNPDGLITKEIVSSRKTQSGTDSTKANSAVFTKIESGAESRFGTSPEELIAQLGAENDPSHRTSVTSFDSQNPSNQQSSQISSNITSSSTSSSSSFSMQDLLMPSQSTEDIKAIVEATRKAHASGVQNQQSAFLEVPTEQQVGNLLDKLLTSGNVDTASVSAFRSQPVLVESLKPGAVSVDNTFQNNVLQDPAASTSGSTEIDINKEIASILGSQNLLGGDILGAIGGDQSGIPLTSQLPHSQPFGTTEFADGPGAAPNDPMGQSVSSHSSEFQIGSTSELSPDASVQRLIEETLPPSNFGSLLPRDVSSSSSSTLLETPPPEQQLVRTALPDLGFDSNPNDLSGDPFVLSNDPSHGNSLLVSKSVVTDTENTNNGRRAPPTDPGLLNIPRSILEGTGISSSRSSAEIQALTAAGVQNPHIGLSPHLRQSLDPGSSLASENTGIPGIGPNAGISGMDPNAGMSGTDLSMGMSSVDPGSGMAAIGSSIFGPTVDTQRSVLDIQRTELQKQAEIEAKRRQEEQQALDKILQEIATLQAERNRKQVDQIANINSAVADIAQKSSEIRQQNTIERVKSATEQQTKLQQLLAEEERKKMDLNRKTFEEQIKATMPGQDPLAAAEHQRLLQAEEMKRKIEFRTKLDQMRAEAANEHRKRAEDARRRQIELETQIRSSGDIRAVGGLLDRVDAPASLGQSENKVGISDQSVSPDSLLSNAISMEKNANINSEFSRESGRSVARASSLQQINTRLPDLREPPTLNRNEPLIIPFRVPGERDISASFDPVSPSDPVLRRPELSREFQTGGSQPTRPRHFNGPRRDSSLEPFEHGRSVTGNEASIGLLEPRISFDNEVIPSRSIQQFDRQPRRSRGFRPPADFGRPTESGAVAGNDFYSDLPISRGSPNSFQRQVSRDWERQVRGIFRGQTDRVSDFPEPFVRSGFVRSRPQRMISRSNGLIPPFNRRRFVQRTTHRPVRVWRSSSTRRPQRFTNFRSFQF